MIEVNTKIWKLKQILPTQYINLINSIKNSTNYTPGEFFKTAAIRVGGAILANPPLSLKAI